jgi:hypothetical protein
MPQERRLTINYVRALIRKSVSYLFPEPPTFAVAPHPTLADEHARRAEAALAGVYAANDLAAIDFATAIDASVLGDGAFKVTWDAAERRPIVTSVDVQGLSAWWRADDPRRVTRIVQRVTMPAAEARERYHVAVPAGATPSAAVVVLEDWQPARFKLTVASQVVRDGPNPFGAIPYIVFANAPRPQEFWGDSDLLDLVDVQRELNRRLSVVSRILELSGNPIAVLENVDASDGIAVGPGAKWELPEGAKAYLLDLLQGGGVRLHLDYIELLYRVLHDLAETPRTAFGDSGRALSGAALEVEIQPLVQKVKRKRRTWESVYARRNALILDYLERFGGLDLGGARSTRTIWGAILPTDRDSLVSQEVSLHAAGLRSARTAIAALGAEDPDRELTLIATEQRQQPGGA